MPDESPPTLDLLLEAAATTVAKAKSCWLATLDKAAQAPRLRGMGRLPPAAGDDAWTLRFITDARSHKAGDIQACESVALSFQDEAADAYVAIRGRARFGERPAAAGTWKRSYDPFFPSETDKANAVFLTVEAERLDLWIRGVTPEPFGLQTTTLERDGAGWRLAGGG